MHDNPKRQLVVILTIVFFGFVGISMPYLIFPPLFLNPAYSIMPADWGTDSAVLLLGVTLAAYPFGQFIGSPILGALSDDYGRKNILSTTLVITAICNLLTAFSLDLQQLWLLVISRFGAGLMEGNIAIARAMVADIKSLSKHETFGKINAAASIAYLLGPLLGGVMADSELFQHLTISTPFYCVCVLFIALALLSTFILRDQANSRSVAEQRSVWQRINILGRMQRLFIDKQLRFLMVVSTVFTLAIDIFYEFGPVYLTAKWMLSPVELVLYNSALCVGLALGSGWLVRVFSEHLSAPIGVVAATGGFFLFLLGMVWTDSIPFMIALFALSGLAIGLGVTAVTVNISDSVSDALQGEVMGVQISLRVLGNAVICLLGGVLLLLSSKIILVLAAALSAAAMLYYWRYHTKVFSK